VDFMQGAQRVCRLCRQARLPKTVLLTFLSTYLETIFGLSAQASAEATHKLLGQVLYPQFLRALFGIAQLSESLDHKTRASDIDLKPIRKFVADLIESPPEH
jgi:hypothetical protein